MDNYNCFNEVTFGAIKERLRRERPHKTKRLVQVMKGRKPVKSICESGNWLRLLHYSRHFSQQSNCLALGVVLCVVIVVLLDERLVCQF
jgi:hypothetical protein